jgi:tripeptide aminopeptidase
MTVTERFLKYVSYPTMSDEDSATTPSTKKQLALAEYLKDELLAIGLKVARVDSYGYVYATLLANTDTDAATVGFIAHMDTSSEAKDFEIKARIVDYNGGDILLNEKQNIYLKTSDYPELEGFKGQRLIVTDGTTLLGADDKAGIAEIITMLERLVKENIPHGKIAVAFTPDEEIGRGADHFDVEGFGADYAYTVDGSILGELEYENFNAASANISIKGRAIHPGTAKGKMINAARIAAEKAFLCLNIINHILKNFTAECTAWLTQYIL